jgi:hypothetical protein
MAQQEQADVLQQVQTEDVVLNLTLESIDFHHASTEPGDEEIRLDIFAGPQLFEFDRDFSESGTFFPIDHTFTFENYNVNRDLIIRSQGIEDDPFVDDQLPRDLTILQPQDLVDHSFTTSAENSNFSYTAFWFVDVDPFMT